MPGPQAANAASPEGMADGIWIFGYGSLMWDPGFAYLEREPALLAGYHRAFCVYSWTYRGTRERPGLVLGLEPGGSCRGFAYRIAAEAREAIFAYLEKREMTNKTYRQKLLPVALPRGKVLAIAYVVDRAQAQYTGRLPLERLAELVIQGHGERGACADYLANTVRHLDELGIREGRLHMLLKLVERRRSR
jgi:glutathione-specific gamma-glutamylcyclotransferase